jgi:predicted HAD superfamily Cof-like phosphohydrolase
LSKEFNDVRSFHMRFDQLSNTSPAHLTKRKLAERANFMLEELCEFADAAGLKPGINEGDFCFLPDFGGDQDLSLQADALVDLVYVVLGTAAMMGLPWDKLWDDVHRANMTKVKGVTHRNMGFGADIAKPANWVGPQTGLILAIAGYDRVVFTFGGDPTAPIDNDLCDDDAGARR